MNDVCQEWKEIVEEYCMTRGVIKEQGFQQTIPNMQFLIQNFYAIQIIKTIRGGYCCMLKLFLVEI